MPEAQQRQDNRIQQYQAWFEISNLNGWLVFEKELKELFAKYTTYMDNPDADGHLLKHYQLIKKGIKLALDIPKTLENKAKQARKEIR